MEAAGRTLIIIVILVNSLVHSVSAQWVQTNGPCGGTFKTVTINDSVLYTNVFGKGVFRTTDEGKSWIAMNDGLMKRDIYELVSLGDELFAGTEFNGLYIYSGSNGRWSPFESKSGTAYNRILNMVVEGSEIWIATDNGLVKLYKENDNWVDSLIQRLIWSQTVAVTDSFIFVSVRNILKRSADNGVTWDTCSTGLPKSTILSFIMLDDRLGLVGTEDGAYITDNGGDSWSFICNGIDTVDNIDVRGFAARNDTILFSSSDRIWISVDKGETWADFNTAFTFTYPEEIGLIGNSVFLATAKGIFKASFTDRNWTDISTGIVTGSVAAMLKVGETIFAGGDANGKIYRSDDNGMNWAVSDSGVDYFSIVHSLTFFDSVLLAGCEYQGLVKSTDSGRSWTTFDYKTDVARSFIETDRKLFVGMRQKSIQSLAAGDTVLQEADAGLEQEMLECGCSDPYPTVISFTALDGTVFAALKNVGIFAYDNNDTGVWHFANNGLSDTNVNALYTVNGILLAGTQDNGIFRSTDRGASWSSSETDLSITSVLTFLDHGPVTFAGTVDGVFFSIDSGMTWHKGENDLKDSVRCLLVDGDYLLAGTATGGVWRRPVGDFPLEVRNPQFENRVKSTFVSMQKRGFSFSCRFNIVRAEWVAVKLYNLQGKMIELMKSSRVSPGEHVFELDLRKYPSGCYIMRFEGGSVYRNKPFIISTHP